MPPWFQAVLILALAAPTAFGAPEGREQEPVVLTGQDLPGLAGTPPGDLVGFGRSGSVWVQVPVQIDQRAAVDLYTVLGQPAGGVELLTYTDSRMFTGGDPDPMFDGDDELVFLAGSAGGPAGVAADPSGVVPGTRHEVRLTDPVTGGQGYLYLFVSDGGLDPSAGAAPVDYRFEPVSGDYRTTYNTGTGMNPETSSVNTPAYTARFSDRWVRDGMEIHRGGAPGVDILDRHRSQFTPTNCSRTEDTFSHGAGAFIVNRSGPVRALRGYMGANSGPTTYRIHEFYREREVVRTVLRVHRIIGVMDFLDYAPAASGMTYRNNLEPGGVIVDGVPDAVTPGRLEWEMVTGPQGTVAQAHRFILEQPGLTPSSYYADQAAPADEPCAGDGSEYGAAGHRFDQPILNTDPELEQQTGVLYRFELIRTLAYGPPDQGNRFAEDLADEVAAPLQVAVHVPPPCPDGDGDGWAVCEGSCAPEPEAPCGDCDDGSAGRSPDAAETCNGIDDDCDGSTDEGVLATYYRDADGDGHGDPGVTARACGPPAGYVADGDDCDDGDGSIHPGAPETCNGVDDDCDGSTDEHVTTTFHRDRDGDGYGDPGSTTPACDMPGGYVEAGSDCDDGNAAIRPGATELCNGVDDDCDGLTDEGVTATFYLDGDGDGYGDPGIDIRACAPPDGYVASPGDCNDGDAAIHPGATESCHNGLDDDCDALVDAADSQCPVEPECPDSDGDSYAVCDGSCSLLQGTRCGDCDDGAAAIRPGTAETCNGVDDDCDARVDEGVTATFYRDSDGDGYGHPGDTVQACSTPAGYAAVGDDCADGDPSIHPGADEICNGSDDDCDGLVDEGVTSTFFRDSDQDGYGHPEDTVQACGVPGGYVANGDDCDDGHRSVRPGAEESCNGFDDDCDGLVDEDVGMTFHRDFDGDGYGDPDNATVACSRPDGYVADSGDCVDSDAAVHPGAAEQCANGIDDDCDGLVDTADDLGVPELCNGLDDDCSGVADDPRCAAFDVNGDGRLDTRELSWLGRSFGLCRDGPAEPWWHPVDYDGSGCIDGDDLVVLANLWGLPCVDGVLVCP